MSLSPSVSAEFEVSLNWQGPDVRSSVSFKSEVTASDRTDWCYFTFAPNNNLLTHY